MIGPNAKAHRESKGRARTYLNDGWVLLASLGELVVGESSVLVFVHHVEDLRAREKKSRSDSRPSVGAHWKTVRRTLFTR